MLALLALPGCGGDDEPVLTPAQEARRAAQAPKTRTLDAGTPRAAVLADLRRTVLADARQRHARGELDGRPFEGARCKPARDDRGLPADAPVVRFTCTAYTTRTAAVLIGTPFVARVDFPAASYAWCLFRPVGGEGAHTADTFSVPPDPRCIER